ncbi:hypothetical protein AMK15_27950 [Streptomyces sp. MJM1172]|nr:hypothetical protein AMK15_27950 [Streptomyces sp. MJM1172]
MTSDSLCDHARTWAGFRQAGEPGVTQAVVRRAVVQARPGERGDPADTHTWCHQAGDGGGLCDGGR